MDYRKSFALIKCHKDSCSSNAAGAWPYRKLAIAAALLVCGSGFVSQADALQADVNVMPMTPQPLCSSSSLHAPWYWKNGGTKSYAISQSCVYADPCSSSNSTSTSFNFLEDATNIGCLQITTEAPSTSGNRADYVLVDTYGPVIPNPNPGTSLVGDSTTTPAFIAFPDAATAQVPSTLVVFLGGTESKASGRSGQSGYSQFIMRAAYDGLPAISLPYSNDYFVSLVCSPAPANVTPDDCYNVARGAVAFGYAVPYGPNATTYSNQYLPWSTISSWPSGETSSVVGELVATLDNLIKYPPPPTTAAYWQQFLVTSSDSPYPRFEECGWTVSSQCPGAYPKWSQIILAGHSQGAGEAAFIAMYLPAGNVVQRVVMLGGPDDCVTNCNYTAYPDFYNNQGSLPVPAAWVKSNTSGISSASFRGLRHGYAASNLPSTSPATPVRFTDEKIYGNDVAAAWAAMNLTGPTTGTVTALVNDTVNDAVLDDGQCLLYPTFPQSSGSKCLLGSSNPSHRFVITQPVTTYSPTLSSLLSHDATAVNPAFDVSILDPNVAYVWDQMLLGN